MPSLLAPQQQRMRTPTACAIAECKLACFPLLAPNPSVLQAAPGPAGAGPAPGGAVGRVLQQGPSREAAGDVVQGKDTEHGQQEQQQQRRKGGEGHREDESEAAAEAAAAVQQAAAGGEGSVEDSSEEEEEEAAAGAMDSVVAQLHQVLSLGQEAGVRLAHPQLLASMDLAGVAELIASGRARRIICMCGAGISVNAGIPDFRSPGGCQGAGGGCRWDARGCGGHAPPGRGGGGGEASDGKPAEPQDLELWG